MLTEGNTGGEEEDGSDDDDDDGDDDNDSGANVDWYSNKRLID